MTVTCNDESDQSFAFSFQESSYQDALYESFISALICFLTTDNLNKKNTFFVVKSS